MDKVDDTSRSDNQSDKTLWQSEDSRSNDLLPPALPSPLPNLPSKTPQSTIDEDIVPDQLDPKDKSQWVVKFTHHHHTWFDSRFESLDFKGCLPPGRKSHPFV